MQKTYRNFFPELPRISQLTNSHCGPAVVQMLLGNLGIKVTQDDVVGAAGSSVKRLNKFGMNLGEFASSASKIDSGLQFWLKHNSSIKELRELIFKYKYPVGVEWQGEFGRYSDDDFGHYSIITNIDEVNGVVYLADPYKMFAGKDRKIKIERFKEIWWDENQVRNSKTGKYESVRDHRVMFIITPKDDVFPLDLKMTKG